MKHAFLIWLLFVITISLMPFPLKVQLGTIGRLHAAGHFFAFLVTVFLLCKELKGFSGRVAGCLSVFALAVTLEILEMVFYRNHFEWRDVAIDASGMVTGIILVTLVLLSEHTPRRLPRK